LTFREFGALQDRHKAQIQREDWRFGNVLSMQFNMNRGEKQKPMMPSDWFPSLKEFDKPVDNRSKWMMFGQHLQTEKSNTQAPEE
jgi:hypothetical protein